MLCSCQNRILKTVKASADKKQVGNERMGGIIRTMSLYSQHSDRTYSPADTFFVNVQCIIKTHCSNFAARCRPAFCQ